MHRTEYIRNHERHNLEIRASIWTDPGCVREANEDVGRYLSPTDPELVSRRGTLTVVADGMGGHALGEIAANMAVEIVNDSYYADRENTAPDALRLAVESANRGIYSASVSEGIADGMGTTFVALVIVGDHAFSAHVGDSRLYRMRSGKLNLLTVDHSMVMEMVGQGIITLDQAKNHEDSNVVLRALGTQPVVDVEVSQIFEIEPGDKFLLCSDGLSDMVSDIVIEAIVAADDDEHSTCEQLVAAAKYNGGLDNITVAMVSTLSRSAVALSDVRITREIEVY